ncbi:hypothetical protein C6369_002685 [Rhodococcus rhodochrous]|nr:hypothetical protein C6369_002685 [Rhodococcus rhodochrous]
MAERDVFFMDTAFVVEAEESAAPRRVARLPVGRAAAEEPSGVAPVAVPASPGMFPAVPLWR